MRDVPYGYCQCGCGQKTSIAARNSNSPRQPLIKGSPCRFVRGHQNRNKLSYTVDPVTGCWLWDGHCNTNGYGQFRLGGPKQHLAHRWYYEQLRGPIPDGIELHHTCENHRCVNPDHLEPMTRRPHRLTRSDVKLTADDVAEIRRLRGQVTQVALAERFHVSSRHISNIHSGTKWTI